MTREKDITFTVIYPDAAIKDECCSEDNPSLFVNLENPPLAFIQDGDEVVIPKTKITILVDYPLVDKFLFPLESDENVGFTRVDLVYKISQLYKWIYATEDKTSIVASGSHPVFEFNRNRTEGYFGIWGHHLYDLDLHTIEYNEEYDYYTLGIDS